MSRAGRGVRAAPARASGFRWRRLIALAGFAIALAFTEAMVVYYLRKLFALQFDARVTDPGFHFPKPYLRHEQARELAPIIAIVCVALIFGRSWWERFGAFLFSFGVWDVFYYVWLVVLLQWPSSLTTRDLLFLIPDEWFAPVWQPLVASCAMIAVSLFIFARRGTRRA